MGRSIGATWVTDIQHFLDAAGAIPEGILGRP
jgi:hypothetical protein